MREDSFLVLFLPAGFLLENSVEMFLLISKRTDFIPALLCVVWNNNLSVSKITCVRALHDCDVAALHR